MKTINPFADKFSTTKVKSLGVSVTTYYCGDKLAYKMYVDGKLLFKGTQFKPGAIRNWDDLEANIDLLSFLSVGIHDTSKEYFDDYTPAQLAWAKDNGYSITVREQLSGLVSDASEKSSEYHADAIKKFTHKTY